MVFNKLIEKITSLESFVENQDENIQLIEDFYSQSYNLQIQEKDNIERFILMKHSILSQLNFSQLQCRSLILMLLDLCERFSLYSCVPHIARILKNNNVTINKRLSASLLFIYPEPKTNSELISKVEQICQLLQEAIDEEEDNRDKSLVTFLNYYDDVIYNTSPKYAEILKSTLLKILDSKKYPFMTAISSVFHQDISDADILHEYIQSKIDQILGRAYSKNNASVPNFLIEKNTQYSYDIEKIPAKFLSIRNVSMRYSTGVLNGRGVDLLNTEGEMSEYMKRFGKMHYAKLLSAFSSPFPQNFNNKVNLIDWGCGQAIASMTFIEKYSNAIINSIHLIEPSEIVLKRAALHCKKFAPNAKIETICKKLDNLSKSDFNLNSSYITIHLFSNILDIDDYIPSKLKNLLGELCSAHDFFVCVSPYISDIKTGRLDSFKRYFMQQNTFKSYHDIETTKDDPFWMCNNNFGRTTISHGFRDNCGIYDANGCKNKWTRVLKVFSI